MKRNATLTLSAQASYPDGGRDEIRYTVPAAAERTAEGLRAAYDEPDESEMGAVRTFFTLAPHALTLTREGAVRCAFRFEEGVPHDTWYETGLGRFPARVTTHALRTKQGKHSSLAEVRYTLELGGAVIEHRLKLLIRTEDET